MATTAKGTPYVESSDLVANYPAVSLALAEHIDDFGGKILKVVNTLKQDIFSTTSTSYVDVTGLTASITPSSITSKILVLVNVAFGNNVEDGLVRLMRNSTAIANGTGGSTQNGIGQGSTAENASTLQASLSYLDSPATISSTTYKIQAITFSGGTIRINSRGLNTAFGASSSITLMEVSA